MRPLSNFLTTLAIALSLSGCVFGNYVQNAPSPYTFYETQPETLTFCATVSGVTQCAQANPAALPNLLPQVMSNPVALTMPDPDTYQISIIPTNGAQLQLPAVLFPNGTLQIDGALNEQMLWADPACTAQILLDGTGSLTSQGPFASGTSLPLAGRMLVSINVVEELDGACIPTLQQMQSCLQSASNCGGGSTSNNTGLQKSIQSMLGPYLTAGVLTTTQIPALQNIAYTVQYQ